MTSRPHPLPNRGLPDGAIAAVTDRGTMMGNRGGCFHRADQTLKPRPWASRQWICCVLQFKDRRRHVMSPGLYTELFFLDEATALAAGHRPCFECRRADAVRFQALFAAAHGLAVLPKVSAMDLLLHGERLSAEGHKRTTTMAAAALPDGAIHRRPAEDGSAFWLRWKKRDWGWSFGGYHPSAKQLPDDTMVEVLTPATIVRVLAAGYRPQVHPSALLNH
jgi:hypothetical protein